MSIGETSTRVPFLQLRLYARGHATRIQAEDFVIEACQSRLTLFDELRIERALPGTLHLDVKVSLLSFERFLTRSVASVACRVALARMFGVAQMRIQFCFLLTRSITAMPQFFEQTAFSQDVLGIFVVVEQFINQFASDGHLFDLLRNRSAGSPAPARSCASE